jgi:uncharacterized membrane protein YagU involved in acid resistance
MKALRTAIGLGTRGVVAGVVGTAFMTAWQEIVAHFRRHSMPKVMRQEENADPWEKAPAPAQVGRLFVKGVLKRDVPPARIPLFTNAVHWMFGTAMGGAYGLLHGTLRRRPALDGPLFGLGVWAQSYATLVPMGLYKPPWAYPAKTIAKDISYHLVYGAGTAAGYKVVEKIASR